jgi:hypothetical protein
MWNELILQQGNGMMKRDENEKIMKMKTIRENHKCPSYCCENVSCGLSRGRIGNMKKYFVMELPHALMTYIFISVRLLYTRIRFYIMIHDVI